MQLGTMLDLRLGMPDYLSYFTFTYNSATCIKMILRQSMETQLIRRYETMVTFTCSKVIAVKSDLVRGQSCRTKNSL